jgi:hypothetical protein
VRLRLGDLWAEVQCSRSHQFSQMAICRWLVFGQPLVTHCSRVVQLGLETVFTVLQKISSGKTKELNVRSRLVYPKCLTTNRVVSSTSVRTVFSDSISAPFTTVSCAAASVALTQVKVANLGVDLAHLLSAASEIRAH